MEHNKGSNLAAQAPIRSRNSGSGANLCAIGKYYADLYSSQVCTGQDLTTRIELMIPVQDKLVGAECSMMAATTTLAKIEQVLFNLPSNKAPGVDGISAKTLRKTFLCCDGVKVLGGWSAG